MRKILVLIILLFPLVAVADNYEKISKMRDRVKTAIADNTLSIERDLGPMVEMLRKSKDDDDQRRLVDILVDFGESPGTPLDARRYLIEQMTPILMTFAETRTNSTFLRGDAITGLRNIGASRETLEKVTAMALKDSDEYVKSRGEILENYMKSMPKETSKPAGTKNDKSTKEALAYLQAMKLDVTVEQLQESAREGQADDVKALLAAGVDVNGGDVNEKPLTAAVMGCRDGEDNDGTLATIDALLAGGANIHHGDENQNTALIRAADQCGPKTVTRLIDAGAKVNLPNGSTVTPLMMALYSNHFDTAEAILAKGGTMSKEMGEGYLSSELGKDPRAKAIVQKALGSAKKPATKKK